MTCASSWNYIPEYVSVTTNSSDYNDATIDSHYDAIRHALNLGSACVLGQAGRFLLVLGAAVFQRCSIRFNQSSHLFLSSAAKILSIFPVSKVTALDLQRCLRETLDVESTNKLWNRDSSVGVATRYGLDGPGIKSRWEGRDFPHASRPALGPTQPTVQRAKWGKR